MFPRIVQKGDYKCICYRIQPSLKITDETTASIRWKAFKAYIRGEIISYIASKAKRHNQKLRILEDQIREAEEEIYRNNDPEKLQNLSILRAKYGKLRSDIVA